MFSTLDAQHPHASAPDHQASGDLVRSSGRAILPRRPGQQAAENWNEYQGERDDEDLHTRTSPARRRIIPGPGRWLDDAVVQLNEANGSGVIEAALDHGCHP
jgi:hypothetical protein